MSVLTPVKESIALTLPTEDDLPCDDGEPMETYRHVLQMLLLSETLVEHWAHREDFFIGGNMFLYYGADERRVPKFIGPDCFVVLDVPRRERKSWVVWIEGKGPDVVIELLSETTAAHDRTGKKRIYQDELRVPEYFWCDPFSEEFAGFVLRDGVYEELRPDPQGRLVSLRLGLALARVDSEYQGYRAPWLRWLTLEGSLLRTTQERAQEAERLVADERHRAEAALEHTVLAQRQAVDEHARAEQEHQRAEHERQRAEHERQRAEHEAQRAEHEAQRAERLAARLRELGLDPDS